MSCVRWGFPTNDTEGGDRLSNFGEDFAGESFTRGDGFAVEPMTHAAITPDNFTQAATGVVEELDKLFARAATVALFDVGADGVGGGDLLADQSSANRMSGERRNVFDNKIEKLGRKMPDFKLVEVVFRHEAVKVKFSESIDGYDAAT